MALGGGGSLEMSVRETPNESKVSKYSIGSDVQPTLHVLASL